MTPQSFGQQLRKLREQRRITLEQISARTKVSLHLLRSLESGGCEGWPGGIYSRGYVRGYAEAIGVDPEEVVAAFAECYPAFAPDAVPEKLVPPAELAQPSDRDEPQHLQQTLLERIKAALAVWFRVAADS